MSENMKIEESRPSWDEYFMELAEVVAKRSTCLRRKVGAVITKDSKILSTGYNGAPHNVRHCSVTGCKREQMGIPSGQRHEICRGVHGEQNAILQAALSGTQIKDAVIYTTTFPCIICAKMLINSGITKVVYKGDYADEMSKEMLEEAQIEIVQFKEKK